MSRNTWTWEKEVMVNCCLNQVMVAAVKFFLGPDNDEDGDDSDDDSDVSFRLSLRWLSFIDINEALILRTMGRASRMSWWLIDSTRKLGSGKNTSTRSNPSSRYSMDVFYLTFPLLARDDLDLEYQADLAALSRGICYILNSVLWSWCLPMSLKEIAR